MRPDMSKILVTAKRRGDKKSKLRRIKRKRGDFETLPFKESIRPKNQTGDSWSNKHYYLGINLTPLKRFIESRIGKHWDAVYSEICEHLNKSSTAQADIFKYLHYYIIVDAFWKENQLYSKDAYGIREIRCGDIYVCPKSKIIKKLKSLKGIDNSKPSCWWNNKEVSDLTTHEANDNFYKKIKGIWYQVDVVNVNTLLSPYDSFFLATSLPQYFEWKATLWRIPSQVATNKRQLSSKDLKYLGLKNNSLAF